MAAVIEWNATKSRGGAARALSITNEYEPSKNSVAHIHRESWEDEVTGLAIEDHRGPGGVKSGECHLGGPMTIERAIVLAILVAIALAVIWFLFKLAGAV